MGSEETGLSEVSGERRKYEIANIFQSYNSKIST